MPTLTYAAPGDPPFKSAVIRFIERLSGQTVLQSLYRSATQDTSGSAGCDFWTVALDRLGIRLVIEGSGVSALASGALPSSGPVVVAANHPYGIVDGLALCDIVSRSRPNFKILINGVLCRDERFDDHFLPIDFSDAADARRTNLRSMREALGTLRSGGALAMFPAGGIATSRRGFGPVRDLPWKPFIAHLVQKTDADVLPVHFGGRNSRLFQVASALSQTLRLSLIIREVLRMRGEEIAVRIGDLEPNEALRAIGERDAITEYLRRQTMGLGRPSPSADRFAG
ncbi:MAG: glycerol acyltransferase [Bacteroidetes bacterium]|jgi:putative hemolysin|nr:glycerol acyltransferase [Bacteroidota bacterium]